MRWANYVGRTVELIYLDKKGAITQRRVQVVAVKDSYLLGFCSQKRGPRSFNFERILAASPVYVDAS
ncbi:hypothetical protein [Paenibacillus turpanensis]|uniref:WYL domain-containing protein n=1 Tax=Paenibacillus turpanensis TaxID=2689078 RepID=UPI001407869E|nr:hypothetical protein [Paenibacillus turpanensis]